MSRSSNAYPAIIATIALLLGCSIYLWARPDSMFYIGGNFAGPLTGQLPTFLHTLAFALASSILVSQHTNTVIASWGLLEALAEIAQHEMIPVPQALLSYQQLSTFDPLDLLAILAAVAVAVLLNQMTRNR